MKILPPHLTNSNFKTKYKLGKLKLFFKKILISSLRCRGLLKSLPLKLLIIFITIIPNLASAQEKLQLLAPLPGQTTSDVPDIPNYIRDIYQFGLGIAGVLAMLMIIWGAIEYTVSGAVDRKADAKDRITQAILGLVLLLATVLILNTISPDLTNFQNIIPQL